MRSNMRMSTASLSVALLAGCAFAQDWNVSVKTDTNGVLRVPLAAPFRVANDIASASAMNASNAAAAPDTVARADIADHKTNATAHSALFSAKVDAASLGSAAYSNAAAFYPASNPSNYCTLAAAAALTNGFVTASVTNGFVTASITNGLGGISAATATQIAQEVVAPYTNGATLGGTAWQNPASATNWTWTSDGDQITLTGYTGPNDVVIPDMLDGLPVTRLDPIFSGLANITSVSGGANLTAFTGGSTFEGCTALASVSLPALVTGMQSTFESCTALVNIDLPSLLTLSDTTFSGISATNIILASLESTWVGAFYHSGLKSISLPSIKAITDRTFEGATNLHSVIFAGNAPTEGSTVYNELPANQITNYITNPTATGWGATFGGMPVVRLPLYASNFTAAGVGAIPTNDARYLASITNITGAAIIAAGGLTNVSTAAVIAAGGLTNVTVGQIGAAGGLTNLSAAMIASAGGLTNVTPAAVASAGGLTNTPTLQQVVTSGSSASGNVALATGSGDTFRAGRYAGNGASGAYSVYAGYAAGLNSTGTNSFYGGYAVGESSTANYSTFIGKGAGYGATDNNWLFIDSYATDRTTNSVGTNDNIVIDGNSGTLYLGRPGGTVYLRGTVNGFPTVPTYYADGTTLRKVGTTFSVQPWIPENLIELRYETWNHLATQERGLLDGPGYWFSDTSGIVTGMSDNALWTNPGYRNTVTSLGVGLVAHYKMNDNAADAVVADSIGTNNGTAQQNTENITVTGKVNTALSFIAGTDYVGMGDVADLRLTTSGSVGGWVKLGSTSDYQTLLSKIDASSGYSGYMLALRSDSVYWTIANDSAYQYEFVPETIATGVWYHAFLTWDGSDIKIYFNGSLTYSAQQTVNVDTGANSFWLGRDETDYAAARLTGYLDDIRVYNRAITSEEIAAIYASGSGTEGNSVIVTNMTLTATNSLLTFVPGYTYASTLINVGTNTLAVSNVVLSVSRDGGTTWSDSSSVTIQDSWDISNKLVCASLWMTNQPTGSNVYPRVILTNNCPLMTVKGVAMPCVE